MTFATGVAKQVVIAREITEGVNPTTGGQTLRRVSSDLALNKDSYESQEILVSQQLRDARHGVHRPQGTFAGQLSPGSFNDFFEGILRSDWAAGAVMSGLGLTLSTSAGTLTLAAPGFFAGGLFKEDIIVLSGISGGNAGLNGVKLRINELSDTVITTRDLPTTGLTTGALTGVTITVAGKKLFIPPTGQVYHSYTMEHWFSDVGVSEAFVGCKFGNTSIALPSTGLVTFSTQIIGIDMIEGTARALTSPIDISTSSALAAVNGKLSYNGVDLGVVTGMNLQIAGALAADPVVGSNIVPHVFNGRVRVTGSMTVLFEDEVIFDTFRNEQEVSASVMLYSGATSASDFMRFTLPRLKLMSSAKSDGDMSLIQSFNFTALENVNNPRFNPSTIILQDSLA